MAYDSGRGRTVLFGGSDDGSGYLGDTWEWDGTTWSQASPATSPPARYGASMAYDSARGRTVLFGGYGATSGNDTWEWDGTAWTEVTPASFPPARSVAAMAYDSARGKTVLFGGYDGTAFLDDTWEWDGTAWTQAHVSASPSARSNVSMAYDSGRSKTVLFGGSNGTSLGETWEWDGTDWTQASPTSSPSNRSDAGIAYDSRWEKTVLFGGFDNSGSMGDTWEWDGTDWTQASPATSPSPRSNLAMAYDSARRTTVVFGGYDGTSFLGDTWVWDGSTDWSQASLPPSPVARIYAAMAYDSAREKTVLFGGYDVNINPLWDTWEWDGTTWTQAIPDTSPSARFGAAMAYDSAREKIVLFGGMDSNNNLLNDMWEFDGTTWTIVGGPMPPPRIFAGMVFDSVRGKTVLFGGRCCGELLGDTWEWDGTSWTEVTPAVSPAARDATMAYDSGRGKTVLFGGNAKTNGGAAEDNDTWEWDGTTWTEVTPAVSPQPRTNHTMAYDSAQGKTVLFGGSRSGNEWFGDTWAWDGTSWTEVNPAASPPARDEATMAYDSTRGKTVLFGGFGLSGNTWFRDTWELTLASQPERPQHTLSVSKNGTGTGKVESAPSGIDCGSTCSADFDEGAVVTLSATEDSGSAFTGWSGDCSGTGSCQVTMGADKSATATFDKIQRALTVSKNGSGSGKVESSPAGIDCGSTCSAQFDDGTVVTLTTTADSGSAFDGWSGACSGTGSCQVTMDAAKSVTATFRHVINNLLKNRGFELDANRDGRPDSWSSNPKFTRRNAVVHGGSFAGRHRATDNSGYTVLQTVSGLSGGTEYSFEGFVNIPVTTDKFTFKLQVQWRNRAGNVIGTSPIKTYTAHTSAAWDKATATMTAPAGTKSARVRMVVSSLNATLFVDDFAFGP